MLIHNKASTFVRQGYLLTLQNQGFINNGSENSGVL